jgi:Methyltransferase domain
MPSSRTVFIGVTKTYLKRVPGLRKVVRFMRRRPAQLPPRERLLAKMPRNSICAEIGVHEGDFAEEILRSQKPVMLHLIDPWRYEDRREYNEAWYGGKASGGQAVMDNRFRLVKRRFSKRIRRKQVAVHRGYSSDIVNEFSDDYFDWIYIDGNHLYEYVKQDLELYYPKVKPGGYITGDDYGVEGWWSNGVQKAVDEFVGQLSSRLRLELIGTQFIIRT